MTTPRRCGDCAGRRHKCLYHAYVTRRVRDWFRKRWWVACWVCNFKQGPFRHALAAALALSQLEGGRAVRRSELP